MLKKIVLFFLIFILASCAKKTVKKPDFLIGYWIRVNDKPFQKTYENWNKDFTGIGFTLQKSDTIFKEVLSILQIKDTLYLKVEGVNEHPTLFKFTHQTETSFVCENPDNEFPKRISYWKTKDQVLHAKVWNEGGYEINFTFTQSL